MLANFNGVEILYKTRPVLYGRVKSSFEFYGMSRPTYNEWPHNLIRHVGGLPDVWRISEKSQVGQPENIPLTEDRQHWLLKINLEAYTNTAYTKEEYFNWFEKNPELALYLSRQLTTALTSYRSHTNKFGMDNMWNYLLKENIGNDVPKFAKLITGWACLKLLMEEGKPKTRYVYGKTSYAFECINASQDVWRYSPLSHPWLFDQPLVTGRTFRWEGAWAIDRDNVHIPYGQFDDKLVFPIWMPAVNEAYIPSEQIVVGSCAVKKWVR